MKLDILGWILRLRLRMTLLRHPESAEGGRRIHDLWILRSLRSLRMTTGSILRTNRRVFAPFAFGALLILLPVMYLVIKNPQEAFAAPWSPVHGNYAQRKQLTLVNNSGQTFESGTTYKVSIDTASLYNTGSLLTTCDDLRVVYQPSNTTAVELKRAVEYASSSTGITTCGTSSATKVVFQLQSSIANAGTDDDYYIYYDNSQASAYSSSDALDAYNVGSKEATFVAPFNGTTTALAAGSGTPTTATGAIRYSGGKSALSFDGAGDYVNLFQKTLTNSSTSFTIDYWIYVDKYPESGNAQIFQFNYPITHHYLNSSGSLRSAVYCDNGDFGTISLRTWTQVTQVNDGSYCNTYTNGVLVESNNRYGSSVGPYSLHNDVNNYGIGRGDSGNFAGKIDEFRVSDTVRYTTNFTPSTTPFVRDEYTKLLLHFDENGDDPRNTGKAIDDSGNGNHGTITGAKYVGGLVGVDNTSSSGSPVILSASEGSMTSQSYASHEGVFIEEGTTNKITNPSFEHTTYDTNWSSPAVFDFDSTADTFTAGMAKRNSAGPFAAGVLAQGKADASGFTDTLTFSSGTQINGSFSTNIDTNQGSLVFWITPEWNGNDGLIHSLISDNWNNRIMLYKAANNLLTLYTGSSSLTTDISSWTAGSTYNVVIRWDADNGLDGSGNKLSLSINDVTTYGVSGALTANTLSTMAIGSLVSGVQPANAIIEGLTIYRRPLFDGTYGIDVGNGDEINQIYNSGTGKDPTLVTGSWDVVFALPTNASTGALTTGTGNAWSHPHASNLLYTSTTNTGGFMMGADASTDGWSEIPWYKVGGASGVVAAYQPIGAASYSASKTNIANPGTYDATEGAAPSWNATNGWVFSPYGSKYLDTGTVADVGYSMLVQFSSISTGYATKMVGATDNFYITPFHNYGQTLYRVASSQRVAPGLTAGNLALAGQYGFRNGVKETSALTALSGPTSSNVKIGFLSDGTGGGNIQAFALYSQTLSDNQVANVTSAMQNLSSSGTYLTPTALGTSEKIFAGGYKYTSTGGNQGIYRSFTATSGGDYVLRALGHSDGTCNPQIKITRADGTTEISHLNGTTTSTRTDPDVYIFTWESPAAESEQVQLINTASSGTCYWHQVEVLSNLVTNPSMETGSGDPWIPTGWSNFTLISGDSEEGTSIVHSGSKSLAFTTSASSNRRIYVPIFPGGFSSWGTWFYSDGASTLSLFGWRHVLQADGTTMLTSSTASLWQNKMGIFRYTEVGSNQPYIQLASGATGYRYADDIYALNLSPVSLTVTPASEANSTETSGLRVDGTDTLTQTIDSISATSGDIRFKATPRHSFATADLLGVTSPVIATFYGDSDDYIKLYRYDDSTLRLTGVFNNTTVNADYASPTLTAGTTYEFRITYTNGGNLVLYIDGTQQATASGVVSFSTTPTTAYFGSDNSGANQYDLTITAPAFTGTITPTENTTAPYYKFGSKSLKLVASADGRYVTSINPGNTNTHTLSAYVYDGTSGNVGGTVSATVAKLVFNGSVVTPASYTDMGGGWWRLSYSAVTANAAGEYGIAILSGKTIYVDGVQLEEKAYATTYTDGTMGTGYAWTGTAHEGTSTRTATELSYASTSNYSPSSGTISFWVKPSDNYPSGVNLGARSIYFTTISGGSGYLNIYWWTNGTGTWSFWSQYSKASGNAWTNSIPSSLTRDNWYHLVVTWDATGVQLTVNGSTGTKTADPLSISGGTINLSSSNSNISEAKIYSTSLTSTEVADLYYSGLGSHSSLAPVATERYTDGEPPVLAWHLNEGYGTTAYDTTIYQNSGTISGATWSDDSVILSGSEGSRSLKFDGVDDKISRSYSNDPELAPGTSAFSVGTWFKHPSTITGTDTLISRYSSTGSGGGYKVYMNSSGFICFGVDDDITWSPDDSACTTTSYADSNWHHVLAIKGTSTIAVYIDGTQKASSAITATGSLNGSSPTFYVGIDSDGTSNPWDGFIDEVRVYNSVRSEEQINQEYIARGTNKGVSAQFGSGGAADTLSQGLVGHWKMDEVSWNGTAGEVLDASGNGNNGTSVNGATTAAGKYGNGGTFDGTGDYVSASSLNNSSMITMSAWVNSNSISTHQNIISGTISSYSNIATYVSIYNSKFQVHDGEWRSTTTTLSSNTWYYLAFTFNGTTKELKLYVNGNLEYSSTGLGVSTYATVTKIGVLEGSGARYFSGKIDDLKIYNRALSPVEVRALYEYAPGPVAHWTMDEGSGQSAYDKSGNSNTGTLGASSSVGSDDPTWVAGKYGKGLSFDGSNDHVKFSLPSLKAVTVSAWVNPRSINDFYKIVNAYPDGFRFNLYSNTGKVMFDASGANNYGTAPKTNSAIPLNQWSYVVGIYDGTNEYLYLNGVKQSENRTTYAGTVLTANVYTIGSGPEYWNGLIDDVRIYNYARTTKQIVQDMNAGHPAVGSPVGSAIAHYKFDEGQGTTARNSGNGGSTLNGTLTNMSSPATSTSGWTNDGKFSKALNFDGSNDHVLVADNTALDLTTSLALSAWVRPLGFIAGSTVVNPIVGKFDDALSQRSYVLYADGDGQLVFQTSSNGAGGGAKYLYSGYNLPTNIWTHVLGLYDGVNMKVFVNGVQIGSNLAQSAVYSGSAPLTVGARYGGGVLAYTFNGSIDEVKIYNYALSEDEVKLEYNQGKAIVMGNLGTTTDGKTASNSQSRAYCPPGNVEGNCAAGQDPSPKVEYLFEENSGSSYNNTGSLGSTINGYFNSASNITRVSGKQGKAINNCSNCVSQASSYSSDLEFVGVNGLTISAWIRGSSTETDGGVIISKPWNSGGGYNYTLTRNGDGTINFGLGGAWQYSLSTTETVSNNQWHYVTVTVVGSTREVAIYIDGRLSNRGTHNVTNWTTSNTNATLAIGCLFPYTVTCFAGSYYAYNGAIDDVKIYNYARTPAQIAWDYNGGAPVAWYRFDECSGTVANNAAPVFQGDAGNDGTITIGASGTQTSVGTCSSGSSAQAWNNGKSGAFNTGMSLDGTDDYITTGDTNININSVSVWVRPASTSQSIIDLDGGTHTITVSAGTIAANGFSSPTIYVDGKVSSTLPNTDWHMITVTTATAFEASNLVLGKIASNYFNGRLDEFKMWTYPLSAAQVKLAFNDSAAVKFKAEDTEKWWLAGGVDEASAVAVYQPKGAASLADSYSNLANPGTYDAAPGVAPTWDATSGWDFANQAYLDTGVLIGNNYTVIARWYANALFTAYWPAVFGLSSDAYNGIGYIPSEGTRSLYSYGLNQVYVTPAPIPPIGAVSCISGTRAYENGIEKTSGLSGTTSSSLSLYIGARHYSGSVDNWFGRRSTDHNYVSAFAIYNTTLTADQVAKITAKMQAL